MHWELEGLSMKLRHPLFAQDTLTKSALFVPSFHPGAKVHFMKVHRYYARKHLLQGALKCRSLAGLQWAPFCGWDLCDLHSGGTERSGAAPWDSGKWGWSMWYSPPAGRDLNWTDWFWWWWVGPCFLVFALILSSPGQCLLLVFPSCWITPIVCTLCMLAVSCGWDRCRVLRLCHCGHVLIAALLPCPILLLGPHAPHRYAEAHHWCRDAGAPQCWQPSIAAPVICVLVILRKCHSVLAW